MTSRMTTRRSGKMDYLEGVAKGARLSLDDILMINARTDLLVTGQKLPRPVSVPGCTALSLLSDDGDRLALGQNWDWRPPLRENTCLLRLSPKDGVHSTENAPCQKKFLKDMRSYVRRCSNSMRKIPVGIIKADIDREEKALYYSCRSNPND